jgi:hypothetical protein
MFADKKTDPGAPTYSLNYLHAHPEITIESIPWHLHTDSELEGGQLQNGK